MDETTDRWADADARARGFIDPQRPVFEPRGRRRRLLTTIISVVAGVALGVGLIVAGQNTAPEDPGSRALPALVLFGLGVVTWIAGTIWARRTGRRVRAAEAIAAPLSDTEKRDFLKQVTAKAPVDLERLHTLIGMVHQQRRVITGQLPRFAAAGVMGLGVVIAGISPALTVLGALVVACMVYIMVMLARHLRHVLRFLDRYDR